MPASALPAGALASELMQALVIEGGRRLSGAIKAAGNKNGALPILAATLLTQEPVTLSNVPRIRDVDTMLELLADLGAEVAWTGPNELRVHTAEVAKYELDPELCGRMRASFLLAGPLLARFGQVTVPPPGGDLIGRRRLDPHIHAFARMGAAIDLRDRYEMNADGGLRGERIFLDEASVMATENTVMAAVLTPGETVIGNAACEPHVQDLCRFLVSLGAHIEGIESNVLRIQGVSSLAGGEWRIGPDHIEVASFIGLAAMTSSDVTIEDTDPNDLISILPAFRRLGIQTEIDGTSIRVPPRQQLIVEDDLGGHIPKIEDGPWPAFPADLTSIALDGGDPGVRHRPGLREDVREPPLLRRQAGRDGREDHPLRSASRGRHRPGDAARATHGEPGHPCRHGDALGGALRRGPVDDRRGPPDRQGVRADRRAAARDRRPHRARRDLTRGMTPSSRAERLRVEVTVAGTGRANVDTGFPVLDRLLVLLAEYARFDLVVALAAGETSADAIEAAEALGEALSAHLRAPGVRGFGSGVLPVDEALAHVVVEVTERPLLASNVDLSDTRVGGLETDLVTDFLRRFAEGAGLNLHVRLIAGDDAQHVLEAMFKALGVALAAACRAPRP